ncbi:hypothetical protein [Geothrix sp. SG200]|uniref:hypothetical protein n=1 Tax=Geothrix sp. SG200 TaxID=2922865 RepID=UPI001FADD087|nr:hypothetical protein [Geothrix sp. SG200]
MNLRSTLLAMAVACAALPLGAGWKKPVPLYPPLTKPEELRETPLPEAWGPQLPGAPFTGAVLTTYLGRFAIHPTRFDAQGRLRWRALRVEGPAGLGPYDHGLEVEIVSAPGSGTDVARITAIREEPGMDRVHAWNAGDFMELPAQFNPDQPDLSLGVFLFQYRLSNRDTFWFPAYVPSRVFLVKRFPSGTWAKARAGTPADLPATFNPEGPLPVEAGPWLKQASARLLALRRAQPAYQPLRIAWAGRSWDAVGPSRPGASTQLEFWPAAQTPGALADGPESTHDLPRTSQAAGTVFPLGGQAARIREAGWDPATGRLARLDLEPWAPDALGFLLGTVTGGTAQATLAQALNDALVDWKVKGLGAYLQNQTVGAAEDFIARLEKTLLRIDLENRKLRQAGDSQEREAANRQASEGLQAVRQDGGRRFFLLPAERRDLGEEDGRMATGASPDLLDLLEQRKAIVSAILANAKQALATARR